MSDEQDKLIESASNIKKIIEQEESIKNPVAKIGIKETIREFKVNTKDPFGHTIVEVLAVGNEYVIFEIDITDINNKLHVYIDGYTNESEAVIIKRYIKVKQKYIEAKGLLYRSTNFGMMKNRVAHTLQSSLSSDEIDGNREFEELIKIIKNESKDSIMSRIFYILPAVVTTLVASIVAIVNMNWRISDFPSWQITCVILGSLLGGTLSILSGLKKYKFEENLNWIYHLMLGIERVFLSCVAGGIAYITLRSEMLFPHVDMENYWGVLLIVVIAGFSEAFIPSALDKALNKISKENEEKPKS